MTGVNAVTRKVNREMVVVLGWGRAILLQLAHPLVAAGVAEHSDFRQDSLGYLTRARRTIGSMLALTFGPSPSAYATARAINTVHDRVHGVLACDAGPFPAGTRYSAHDPELLRWVHATLLDSVPMAYELFVGPLTSEEQDRYCQEATEMEAHLGMPRGLLPRDRAALDRYLETMRGSGQLHVTDAARQVAHDLLWPRVGLATPFFSPARLITIGLLPPAIRDEYKLPWGSGDAAAFQHWIRRIRRVRACLPAAAREWPQARRSDRAAAAGYGEPTL